MSSDAVSVPGSADIGRVETPDGPANAERARRAANRADEDAAALAVVLAVLTANTAPEPEPARTVWGNPAYRLRVTGPGRHGWWASGLPS